MKTVNYLILIGLCIINFACNSDLEKDLIFGQWKVSDIEFDIQDVPPQLIENARTLGLSTTYRFNQDLSYCITVSKNHLDPESKQVGTMIIDTKNLTLTMDTLLFENNKRWAPVQKNDFNKKMFVPIKMTFGKISQNQLILSEKSDQGTIFYTLDRVK